MLDRTAHQAILEIVADVTCIGAAHITAQTYRAVALKNGARVGAVGEETVGSFSNLLHCADEARCTPTCSGTRLRLLSYGSAEGAILDGKGAIIRHTADKACTVGRSRSIAPNRAIEFATFDGKLILALNDEAAQGVGIRVDGGTDLDILNGGGTVHGIDHASRTSVCLNGTCNLEVLDNCSFASGAEQTELTWIGKVVRDSVSLAVQRAGESCGKSRCHLKVSTERDGSAGVGFCVRTHCLPVFGRVDGEIVSP